MPLALRIGPRDIDWNAGLPDAGTLCVDNLGRFLRCLGFYRAAIASRLQERLRLQGRGEPAETLLQLAERPDLALHSVRANHAWLATRRVAGNVDRAELAPFCSHESDCPPEWRLIEPPAPAWVEFGLTAIDAGLTRDEKPGCLAGDVGRQRVGHAVVAALRLLSRAWRQEAIACTSLITDVVPVDRAGFHSSSIPATFGAVYLGSTAQDSVLGTLLLLVHEAAHHKLIVETARGALLLNPTDTAASPLRPEPRPIMAVLHATFVASKLAECVKRVEQVNGASGESQKELERYCRALDVGLKTLVERAMLTPRGDLLLQLMRATA